MLRTSLLISLGRTGGMFAIQMASSIIIARLLLPNEIGVFSVAMAVTAVLHALRDFGAGRYLIKEEHLTRDKLRTVFGMLLLIGWGIAAALWFGRESIAAFYEEPALAGILGLMCFTFLMLPFGQPALTLLRREQRYARVAVITLVAAGLSAATSIWFAYQGHGPYALAYGALVNGGVTVVMALGSRPEHILMTPSFKEWRAVFAFGSLASAGTIVVHLGMQAPELVMGSALGFTAVGLYSRGLGLAMMVETFFVAALTWIAGSELAALRRAGDTMRALCLKITDYGLVIGWPALIFMALKAEDILFVLYGETWLPATPLVQALCVARIAQLLVAQAPALYEATGAVGLQLRNALILQAFSVVLVIAGAAVSVEMVALLRIPLAAAAVVVHLVAFRRFAGVGAFDLLRTVWRSAAVAAGFAAVLYGLQLVEPEGRDIAYIRLFAEAAVMGVVFLVLVFALRHPIRDELRHMVQALPLRLGKTTAASRGS